MVRTSDLEIGRLRVRFSPGARKFSLPRASIVSPYSKRKMFPGVYACCSLVNKYCRRLAGIMNVLTATHFFKIFYKCHDNCVVFNNEEKDSKIQQ